MRECACAFHGSAHLSFSGTQVSSHRYFGRFQYCSTRSSRLQTGCYTLAARRSSWSLLRLAFCGHGTCRREAATWMHPRTRLQKRCLQCYRMRWSLWCPGRGLRCAPSVKPCPLCHAGTQYTTCLDRPWFLTAVGGTYFPVSIDPTPMRRLPTPAAQDGMTRHSQRHTQRQCPRGQL